MSIWNSALHRLSSKIHPQNYEMWLRPIECRKIEGDRILLRAPNQYVRLWFESNYLPILLDELRAESDRDYRVEFEIAESSGRQLEPVPPTPPAVIAAAEAVASETAAPPTSSSVVDAAGEFSPPTQLSPRYVFETFVAG